MSCYSTSASALCFFFLQQEPNLQMYYRVSTRALRLQQVAIYQFSHCMHAQFPHTHTHNHGCVYFSLFSRDGGSLCVFFFHLISLLCPSNLHFRDAAASYLAHISTNIAPFFLQVKEEIKCNVCLEGQCVCIDSVC